MNLTLNARDAMPNGGRLTIETSNVEIGEDYCSHHTYARPGWYVLLSVSDTGVGMDRATMEQIFEPFFTTKEMGKGTGLGLATVYGIVKQHGGFIEVDSAPGEGTTFQVYLPASAGAPEIRETHSEDVPRKGTETILVAEDHEGLRQSAQEMLEALGYHVIVASDGLEAVQLYTANRNQISLVILDAVMPGLSGPNAFLQMAALQPKLPAIFTTGYTNEAESLASMLEKGASFLQKPYSQLSISQMIRSVLDHSRPVVHR
jgi:two-component system cell cycle sensor histidine kinase/response regulator CckA